MKEWIKTFWGKHGERLVFLALANGFASILVYYKAITLEEAKVIFVGSMGIFFNKARGNGTPTKGE